MAKRLKQLSLDYNIVSRIEKYTDNFSGLVENLLFEYLETKEKPLYREEQDVIIDLEELEAKRLKLLKEKEKHENTRKRQENLDKMSEQERIKDAEKIRKRARIKQEAALLEYEPELKGRLNEFSDWEIKKKISEHIVKERELKSQENSQE